MGKQKVLVVDSDKNLLLAMNDCLEAADYEVLFATTASIAVSMALRKDVDIVILDLDLPDGDGRLVIERINTASPGSGVPVIVLSRRSRSQTSPEAFGPGVVAYFDKPLDIDRLIETVRGILPVPETMI
jgi:DNA-binding response OmpR family regulator